MRGIRAYVFVVCAMLLSGCADKLSIPVRIEMTLVDLYPTKAIVQFAPGSEDAWYGMTVVAAENARTPEEREALADEYIAFMAGQYANIEESDASFAHRYFYRGTAVHRIKYLSNGAAFVLLAFQLNPDAMREAIVPPIRKTPISAGTVNAVIAGTKTIVMPETMPGTESGSTTRKKVITPFAPRSRDASRRLLSIFESELYSGSIINGRKS